MISLQTSVMPLTKNNVEISDLALMTDDIPEDAEELVIMSPTTDFSEMRQIKSLPTWKTAENF